jgi:heptosyltransferase-2
MRCLIFKINQLGDNVVFLSSLQELLKRDSDCQISLVTSPLAAPLYQTTLPQIRLLTYPTTDFNSAWKNPLRLLNLAKTLRAEAPDACLVANDQGNVAHLLARLSGAPLRIGPLNPHLPLRPLLTHRVPLDPKATTARHNWHLISEFLHLRGLGRLEGTPPPPDLSAFGVDPHGTVVIHPEASRAYQRWPAERYLALANHLAETSSMRVTWIHYSDHPPHTLHPTIRLLQPPDLATLVRCLAGARFFIGNNSGPMHLASALGIPSVIPIGPSAYNWDPEWHREGFDLLREPVLPCQPCDSFQGPVGVCRHSIQPMQCLDRWSVNAVYDRVIQRLTSSIEV